MAEFIVSTLADEHDGNFEAGDLSLREAIAIAEPGSTITFAPDLSGGTINLVPEELVIDKDLTIRGLGANNLTIDGSAVGGTFPDFVNTRVLRVDDGNVDIAINVTLEGITITGGTQLFNGSGAGILNQENLTVISSIIAENTIFRGAGGGIANNGNLLLVDSLVRDNSASFQGSAGGGISNSGTATIINSTITNNSSFTVGGGISNFGILELLNTTVANNSAAFTGDGISGNGSIVITSSIIANNSENDLEENASLTSGGNNLIGNAGSANGFTDGANGDLVGTPDAPIDSRLGELQDNGGATPTLALLDGSPAIDAGSNPNGLETDQRGDGFARTLGNGTDIGAFEVQTTIPRELVVSTLEDENDGDFSQGDLSLREAIAIANLNELITFDSNLSSGTITLTLGELVIDKSLEIRGLGANNLTIDGNNQSRIFNIYDSDDGFLDDVSIEGLTLANGNTGDGSFPEINGGGILNRENLFLNNIALIGNRAGNGGAIFNLGQVQLDNSLVSDSDGTAPLFNDGGTAFVANSTFTNNIVAGTGAIANTNGGTLDLSNSTIVNNSGYDFVVFNSDNSTATVSSTIIANNEGSLFPEFSDAGGTFISGGNNLIGNNNGAVGFDNSTDLVGTTDNRLDARLGELQDNGGAIPTIALLEDSPAIDAGSNPNDLIFDQRGIGFNRFIGAATDIGAFELQTVVTPRVNEVIGTNRGDVLNGTETSDHFVGLEGNDTIKSFDDDDTIEGNSGNDSLDGGAGHDLLDGSEGFDTLLGGDGNDTLNAGTGNDSLVGSTGDDYLNGSDGRDTLLGGDGNDFLDGGENSDSLEGGAGNDLLIGWGDRDTLLGNDGDDVLEGGAGVDFLDGGVGNDSLFGLEGNDSLLGGNGNDFIDGGAGHDYLRGDDGDDIFVLTAGGGTDTIVDFARGNNLLGLSFGISFADLTFAEDRIIWGDETLATLNGFSTVHLTESDFTFV
ncbi:MAG: calcium-binding protein [Cyanobacteria bacterium J06623_7]